MNVGETGLKHAQSQNPDCFGFGRRLMAGGDELIPQSLNEFLTRAFAVPDRLDLLANIEDHSLRAGEYLDFLNRVSGGRFPDRRGRVVAVIEDAHVGCLSSPGGGLIPPATTVRG
jgi:hypothetical protein